MEISSTLDVPGENYSRSDSLVNACGSTVAPDRSYDVDGHKTRVGTSTLYKIKTKANIKTLTSTSLDTLACVSKLFRSFEDFFLERAEKPTETLATQVIDTREKTTQDLT